MSKEEAEIIILNKLSEMLEIMDEVEGDDYMIVRYNSRRLFFRNMEFVEFDNGEIYERYDDECI